MSHTPDTPVANLSDWNRFYAERCEEERAFSLPHSPGPADGEVGMMPQDVKGEYRDQSYGTLEEPPQVTKHWEYLYGVDDLVDNVVRLDPTSVKQEEFSPPPCYSESEFTPGSPAFDEFSTPSPSTFDQVHSPEFSYPDYGSSFLSSLYTSEVPTPGPSSHMDQPPFPVASPSSPLPAPTPSYPIHFRRYTSPDGTNSPPFNEATSNYLDLPQNPASPYQGGGCFDHPYGGAFHSNIAPVGIDGSGPTAAPLTPTTGYNAFGLATPRFTSGLCAHDLPAELDNNQFAFTGMDAGVPQQQQQPVWNFGQGSGCVDQQSMPFPSPGFAPVAPAPPFPVDRHSVSQEDQKFWENIAKTLESDQPQAAPAPIPQQVISFPTPQRATVKHTFKFKHSVSVVSLGGTGQDGTPLQISMPKVNITFTTEPKP